MAQQVMPALVLLLLTAACGLEGRGRTTPIPATTRTRHIS